MKRGRSATRSATDGEWLYRHMKPLFNLVKPIAGDGLATTYGDMWSIKKELAIKQYIKPYHDILKSGGHKITYYDPFCGSGLIGFRDKLFSSVRFPGSPIVASPESGAGPFDEYLISDSDKGAVDALNCRMEQLSRGGPRARVMKFSESIAEAEARAEEGHVLAVIDPHGYSSIPWGDVSRVLKLRKCDLFIVAMVRDLNRNLKRGQGNPSYGVDMTRFLGNDAWRECKSGSDLVKKYCGQITPRYKRHHRTIGVRRENGVVYEIIFASRSDGAKNVIDGIFGRLDRVETKDIERQALTASGLNRRIDRDYPHHGRLDSYLYGESGG